jgi:membrane fusion protein, multidrug efflux system
VRQKKPVGARVSISMAVMVVLASACGKSAPPPAPPPPEVGVVEVQPQRVPTSFEITGEVLPYRRVEVRSRIDGVIQARPFTEGATVKRGQVLYRIDPIRPEAAFRSAQARYQNAKRTLDRLRLLLAQHAVAQQDVDNAQADMEQAEADLADAKKNLEDAVVRAEITGRVGRTNLEVGSRVRGSDDVLTMIDVLDPAYVSFRPSAQQLLTWKQDPNARKLIQPASRLSVHVTLPDGSTLPRTGKLDFVAPSLDAETGTQEFRAIFPNADHLLVPGQFVQVKLTGFTKDSALAVPQRAVQQALGRQYVYVVAKGDTVVSRDVEPGPWSGNLWIINKGLNPGERVIVDGTQKAVAGRPVRPVRAADSVMASPQETARVGATQ